MPVLTKDTLPKINDRPTVEVDMSRFAGWEGITVLLRAMEGTQRAEVEKEWLAMPAGEQLPPNFKERVLCRCIVDESGETVFTYADIGALAAKNGAAIDHVYKKAAEMNGLNATAVEDAAKN